MTVRNGEDLEWDVRKWKSEIDKMVKCMGLSKWKDRMEQKSTLEWYTVKRKCLVFYGGLISVKASHGQFIPTPYSLSVIM